jgi:protoporphyrinogen oxidase
VRVAVIGAGVCGLVAAYRLTQAGHACDVYERWPGLGGQAATLDVGDGHRLERYYHHLFSTDRHIGALYVDLGMPDEIEWLPSSVAYFARGRQWPFVTPLDLLRFGPLPPLARVRMGAGVLALQRLDRPLEDVTARAWIERWMGAAAWREVWGPLLRGKFGARADAIAMVWLQSKLGLRREDAGEERLGYPRRSWEPLFEALRGRVEAGGGRVMVDRPAARIDRDLAVTAGAPGSFRAGHDPRAFAPAGPPERYDAVLATVPNDVFERLLAPGVLPEAYVARLRGIEYFTALCLLLELEQRFSPFYWTNIGDDAVPFVGLIEHTNLIGPERYDGRRFLYVANYLPAGHELLALDADALLARYEPSLRRINPSIAVRRAWLHREPAAQPIVTVGYQDKIPPLRTPLPGLFLANTTQIYPEDRGTNYAVQLGGQASDAIMANRP